MRELDPEIKDFQEKIALRAELAHKLGSGGYAYNTATHKHRILIGDSKRSITEKESLDAPSLGPSAEPLTP